MGSAITFDVLMANANSEKVFLAELRLGELLTNWTLTSGQTYTYETPYAAETITLADGTTETFVKNLVRYELDGVALTERSNITDVENNPGSYFHDATSLGEVELAEDDGATTLTEDNGTTTLTTDSSGTPGTDKIYVHPPADDSPLLHTIIVYFWMYFATKGLILDNRFYEPYIAERGIPNLNQKNADVHWGVSEIGSGMLILLNGRGYFDQISRKFLWTNKIVRILLGGDSLPYSEYEAIFTGRIQNKNFTSRELTLDIRSNSFDLLRQLPINNFWTSTYASLDPAVEGRPIPYYYGVYDDDQAPEVTCINTAYGADTYQFKICDHAIKSVTQVYINYEDGVGWQTIAHANEDLPTTTFTITSASFVLGVSRVKVAFEGKATGGVVIEGAPEITEDILLNFCGYAATDLDTASFTASKTLSSCTLNVPVETEQSALSIIEQICKSDLAFFDEDGEGLLRYRTWEIAASGTIPVLNATDILEPPEILDDIGKVFWKIKIGYSFLCSQREYLYSESYDNPSKYKYEKREILIHDTYLRTSADAENLGISLIRILQDISPQIRLSLKLPLIKKTLGDKIKVTLARAPYSPAGGYSERLFEITERNLNCFPLVLTVVARDLMDFGSGAGFWTSDSIPAWSVATQQQRDDSGWWCDANGYADPLDLGSQNKSLWW